MTAPRWQVHVTATAVADFADILEWTTRQFGENQALIYETILTDAIDALSGGPDVAGARLRDAALRLRTLHVARKRSKGRHILLFRVDRSELHSIEVLRILHDAMDTARHYPGAQPQGE